MKRDLIRHTRGCHFIHWSRLVFSCCLTAISLLGATGCEGDDPQTVAIIQKHLTPKSFRLKDDENGVKRIYYINIPDRREALEILRHLNKLKHLEALKISCTTLTDEDLQTLPSLPELKVFATGNNQITDEGLQYLQEMKSLQHLSISQTKVRGPGLFYLKDSTDIGKLELHSTPVDDRAIPLITDQFKKLEHLDLGDTHVTPEGVMKLVDLHWLEHLTLPDDLVGEFDNRSDLLKHRRAFLRNFSSAHIESKRAARAAGLDVPEDRASPYSQYVLSPSADE